MPRTPIDYSKTVFYKIVCNDLSMKDCYIGHTTDFTKRKYNHKSDYFNEKRQNHSVPLYKCIREHGGWENWSIVPLEEACLSNIYDALRKEREYFEALGATLNKHLPAAKLDKTKSEYDKEFRVRNLESIKHRSSAFYSEHKDEINQYKKEWYERSKIDTVCDVCGSMVFQRNLQKHHETIKCQSFKSQ